MWLITGIDPPREVESKRAEREDGRIESTTAPLLSSRTAHGVMELLEAMLHMGSAL